MTVTAPGPGSGLRALALVALLTLPSTACDPPLAIYGAAVSGYIAQVSVDGVAGQLVQGSAPPPGAGPTVTAPALTNAITGGSSQAQLTASADFQTAVIDVDGVDGYWLVTLPAMTTQASLVVTIGSALPELEFDYRVAVAGADGVIGPYSQTSVVALEVIRGDIQVSVSWNTVADVDLHVIDPSGEEIYFGNRSSASGGELDLDANAACSTSDIYQENIGWPRNSALPGKYIVRVEYWDACGVPETDFVVTVSLRPGVPVTPITPGSALRTFIRNVAGSGTQGGAGSGATITSFIF